MKFFIISIILLVFVQHIHSQILGYYDDSLSWSVDACNQSSDSIRIIVQVVNNSNDSLLLSSTSGNYIEQRNDSTIFIYIGWNASYLDENLKRMVILKEQGLLKFEKIIRAQYLSFIYVSVYYMPNVTKTSLYKDGEVWGGAHVLKGIRHSYDLRLKKMNHNFANCKE